MARRTVLSLALAVVFVAACASAALAGDREPRIVGGAPKTIQEFPWQVALAVSQDSVPGEQDGYERQFCGGTLVAPTVVITAAHCVYDYGPLPVPTCLGLVEGFDFPAEDFAVFTGRTTLSAAEGQEIAVSEIYYFEGSPDSPVLEDQSTDAEDGNELFDCATSEWDAVFLTLAQPSTTGTPIKIAGPAERSTWAPGSTALISGWGDLADGAGDYPDQLHGATVQMLSDADCAQAYGAEFFSSTMVCAGQPGGGADTCAGDSGGPLVVPVVEPKRSTRAVNAVRLVGDTSFGEGCGRPGFPGVYGRLADDPMRSAFRSGIQQVAGVDVVGAGATEPDSTPPQTRLDGKPKKTVRTRRASVRLRFRFSASEEKASFRCRKDNGAFKPCSSPHTTRFGPGRHSFQVRATDEQGNVDPTPAKTRFRVKRA